MILLIDNYDSFSFNVYQLIGSINSDIKVVRNDEMSVEEMRSLHPSHLVISPGPGRPEDAGVCGEAVRRLAGSVPILGICLGHQAICQTFGAQITYAGELVHGKQSLVRLNPAGKLFAGLGPEIKVARYHSLTADPGAFPEALRITAQTADGTIMAVEHRNLAVFGVQFHPESVLTPDGCKIIENFLNQKCEN